MPSENQITFTAEAIGLHDDVKERGIWVEQKLTRCCIAEQALEFGSR